MAQLRMAELREGVWLRPDNLALGESTARQVVDAQCVWFVGQPHEQLAAGELFGLADWSAAARDVLASMTRTAARLRARDADALGETFVIAAAATRHLTLDPLLPRELLPTGWPGPELRRAYDAYQRDFAATWRAWYRSLR
jgi:phenylacetic acid degradation operon negative regulatory protein